MTGLDGEWRLAFWRELDQMRVAAEKAGDALRSTLAKLEERDEQRDGEVDRLKLEVARLRSECRRNMKRDAGLVIAPTTIMTVVVAVLNWVTQPPVPPPPPVKAETVQR